MNELAIQIAVGLISGAALLLSGLIAWVFVTFREDVMTELRAMRKAHNDIRDEQGRLELRMAAEYVKTEKFEAYLDRINERIDQVGDRVEQKFEAIADRIDERFDRLNERLEQKVDRRGMINGVD